MTSNERGFIKNVMTLMVGGVLSQLLPILMSPILTRVYTPAEFGTYALYVSLSGVLISVCAIKYDSAIMLPRENEEASILAYISMLIILIFSILILLIIVMVRSCFSETTIVKTLGIWLYLLPASVVFGGFVQTIVMLNNRNKKYKKTSLIKVFQSCVSSAGHVGLCFLNGGLILGSVVGHFLTFIYLLGSIRSVITLKDIKFGVIVCYLKKYKRFPLYVAPGSIVDGVRIFVLYALITFYYDDSVLGQYSIAWRITALPVALIGGALSQVIYKELSVMNNTDISGFIHKYIGVCVLCLVPIFSFLYVYLEDLFVIVFGRHWLLAGAISAELVPWIMMSFITSPLSSLFLIYKKQNVSLFFSFFYMLLPIVIMYFFQMSDFLIMIGHISKIMSLFLIVYLACIIYFSKKRSL